MTVLKECGLAPQRSHSFVPALRGQKMSSNRRGAVARLAAFALAGALAAAGLAQKPGETIDIKPSATATAAPVVDSTLNYFPQINTSLKQRPYIPSNPKSKPSPLEANNGMATGSVLTAPIGQAPHGKFPGIGFTGPIPPDPDIAVGPRHVIEVVNGAVAFFEKNGKKIFQQQDSPTGFWSGLNATDFIFDPKAFYDHIAKRYFIVELEVDDANKGSWILLAVSDDDNPVGTWFKYRIAVNFKVGDNDHWLDYPGLGYNKDGFVITGNMFPFENGEYFGQAICMPKAPMLSGQAVTVTKFRTEKPQIQLARTPDASMTSVFGMARSAFNGSTLYLFAFRGLAGSPTMSQTAVAVPTYVGSFGDVPAKGSMLDSIGDRIMSAYARAGRVFATHTTLVAPGGNHQVSWYEINPGNWPVSGTPALVQSGNVSSTTFHYWMPSIAQNSLGDVVLVYSRANNSTFPQAVYSARRLTDAKGAMGAPVLFGESAGVHNFWRFGDYSDVEVDPSNGYTFFGVANTFGATRLWDTVIGTWNVSTPSGGAGGLTPASATVVNGTLSGGNTDSLKNLDRNFYRVASKFVTNIGQVTDTDFFFNGVSRTNLNALEAVASASQEGGEVVTGTLYIWNFATSKWDVLKQGSLPWGQNVTTISGRVSTNPLNFVSTAGQVRLRLRSFEGINRLRGNPRQHTALIDRMLLAPSNS